MIIGPGIYRDGSGNLVEFLSPVEWTAGGLNREDISWRDPVPPGENPGFPHEEWVARRTYGAGSILPGPHTPSPYQVAEGAVYTPPVEPGDAPSDIVPIPGMPVVYDGGGSMLPATVLPGSSPYSYVPLSGPYIPDPLDGGGGDGHLAVADISALGVAVAQGNIGVLLALAKALIARYGLTLVKGALISLGATWIISQLTGGDLGGDTPPERTIVKRWSANGWPFMMDDRGHIWTKNKDGVWKHWKPAKPIVMVRGRTTLAGAVKAQRYLDHMWRTVAKRTKALKLA